MLQTLVIVAVVLVVMYATSPTVQTYGDRPLAYSPGVVDSVPSPHPVHDTLPTGTSAGLTNLPPTGRVSSFLGRMGTRVTG